MKHLFVTTAVLALSAGFAAAEVTLSGDARMGILNGFELDPTAADDTGFTSRARVKFTLSGETDTGLSFGASFRADNAGGAASGTAGSVFVSGAFGKLSMGDVDGAANAAVGHVDGVGLTGLGDHNEMSYLATGGFNTTDIWPGTPDVSVTSDPSVLYEYSAGALSFYASATQPTYTFDSGFGDFEGDAYSLAFAYTVDAYRFSAGYEKLSIDELPAPGIYVDADHWILGADGTFGAVTLKARYGKADIDDSGLPFDFEQWSLSGTYTMDAVAVTAYASSKHMTEAGFNVFKKEAIGLGASYDLGGGASVVGGIARLKETEYGDPSASDTAFDLGLSFSF